LCEYGLCLLVADAVSWKLAVGLPLITASISNVRSDRVCVVASYIGTSGLIRKGLSKTDSRWIDIHPSTRLYLPIFIHPSIHKTVPTYIHPSTRLYLPISIHPSIHPQDCTYLYPSIHNTLPTCSVITGYSSIRTVVQSCIIEISCS
jgi:hypothetical protein